MATKEELGQAQQLNRLNKEEMYAKYGAHVSEDTYGAWKGKTPKKEKDYGPWPVGGWGVPQDRESEFYPVQYKKSPEKIQADLDNLTYYREQIHLMEAENRLGQIDPYGEIYQQAYTTRNNVQALRTIAPLIESPIEGLSQDGAVRIATWRATQNPEENAKLAEAYTHLKDVQDLLGEDEIKQQDFLNTTYIKYRDAIKDTDLSVKFLASPIAKSMTPQDYRLVQKIVSINDKGIADVMASGYMTFLNEKRKYEFMMADKVQRGEMSEQEFLAAHEILEQYFVYNDSWAISEFGAEMAKWFTNVFTDIDDIVDADIAPTIAMQNFNRLEKSGMGLMAQTQMMGMGATPSIGLDLNNLLETAKAYSRADIKEENLISLMMAAAKQNKSYGQVFNENRENIEKQLMWRAVGNLTGLVLGFLVPASSGAFLARVPIQAMRRIAASRMSQMVAGMVANGVVNAATSAPFEGAVGMYQEQLKRENDIPTQFDNDVDAFTASMWNNFVANFATGIMFDGAAHSLDVLSWAKDFRSSNRRAKAEEQEKIIAEVTTEKTAPDATEEAIREELYSKGYTPQVWYLSPDDLRDMKAKYDADNSLFTPEQAKFLFENLSDRLKHGDYLEMTLGQKNRIFPEGTAAYDEVTRWARDNTVARNAEEAMAMETAREEALTKLIEETAHLVYNTPEARERAKNSAYHELEETLTSEVMQSFSKIDHPSINPRHINLWARQEASMMLSIIDHYKLPFDETLQFFRDHPLKFKLMDNELDVESGHAKSKVRGSYSPDGTISISIHGDISTVLHETTHAWLERTMMLADQYPNNTALRLVKRNLFEGYANNVPDILKKKWSELDPETRTRIHESLAFEYIDMRARRAYSPEDYEFVNPLDENGNKTGRRYAGNAELDRIIGRAYAQFYGRNVTGSTPDPQMKEEVGAASKLAHEAFGEDYGITDIPEGIKKVAQFMDWMSGNFIDEHRITTRFKLDQLILKLENSNVFSKEELDQYHDAIYLLADEFYAKVHFGMDSAGRLIIENAEDMLKLFEENLKKNPRYQHTLAEQERLTNAERDTRQSLDNLDGELVQAKDNYDELKRQRAELTGSSFKKRLGNLKRKVARLKETGAKLAKEEDALTKQRDAAQEKETKVASELAKLKEEQAAIDAQFNEQNEKTAAYLARANESKAQYEDAKQTIKASDSARGQYLGNIIKKLEARASKLEASRASRSKHLADLLYEYDDVEATLNSFDQLSDPMDVLDSAEEVLYYKDLIGQARLSKYLTDAELQASAAMRSMLNEDSSPKAKVDGFVKRIEDIKAEQANLQKHYDAARQELQAAEAIAAEKVQLIRHPGITNNPLLIRAAVLDAAEAIDNKFTAQYKVAELTKRMDVDDAYLRELNKAIANRDNAKAASKTAKNHNDTARRAHKKLMELKEKQEALKQRRSEVALEHAKAIAELNGLNEELATVNKDGWRIATEFNDASKQIDDMMIPINNIEESIAAAKGSINVIRALRNEEAEALKRYTKERKIVDRKVKNAKNSIYKDLRDLKRKWGNTKERLEQIRREVEEALDNGTSDFGEEYQKVKRWQENLKGVERDNPLWAEAAEAFNVDTLEQLDAYFAEWSDRESLVNKYTAQIYDQNQHAQFIQDKANDIAMDVASRVLKLELGLIEGKISPAARMAKKITKNMAKQFRVQAASLRFCNTSPQQFATRVNGARFKVFDVLANLNRYDTPQEGLVDAYHYQAQAYFLNEVGIEATKMHRQIEKEFNQIRRIIGAKNVTDKIDAPYVETVKVMLSRVGLIKHKNAAVRMDLVRRINKEEYDRVAEFLEQSTNMQHYTQMQMGDIFVMLDLCHKVLNEGRQIKYARTQAEKIHMSDVAQSVLNSMDALYEEKPELKAQREAEGKVTELGKAKEEELTGIRKKLVFLKRLRNRTISMRGLCQIIDGKSNGDLFNMIFKPIQDAESANILDDRALGEQLNAATEKVKDWFNDKDKRNADLPQQITLGEDLDGKSVVINAERGLNVRKKLIPLLLHIGNDSNLDAVARSLNMDADDFVQGINRLHEAGIINKDMMDYVQAIWDAYEKVGEKTAKAHYEITGKLYTPVKARAVKIGGVTYKGGYAPLARRRDNLQIKSVDDILNDFSTELPPSTDPNFTKERSASSTAPLDLSFDSMFYAIERQLRYANMMPAVNRSYRFFQSDAKMVGDIERLYPGFTDDIALPWLKACAEQRNNDYRISREAGWLTRIGSKVNAIVMTLNVLNAVQQFTGLVVATVKVPTTALIRGVVKPMSKKDVCEKSKFMATRIRQGMHTINMVQRDSKVFSKWRKTFNFLDDNSYVLQTVTQNWLDRCVWTAKYEDVLAKTQDEARAIAEADNAVAMTQGSFRASDSTGADRDPITQILTPFTSYFTAMRNLFMAEFSNMKRRHKNRLLRAVNALMLSMQIVFLPAVLGWALKSGGEGQMYGDIEDEEATSLLLDGVAVGPAKQVASMVHPAVGVMFGSVMDFATEGRSSSSLFNSPLSTLIPNMERAVASVVKYALGDSDELKVTDINGLAFMAAAVGLLPNLTPAIGKSAFVAWAVANENLDDNGFDDTIRAIITGKPSPVQKGER